MNKTVSPTASLFGTVHLPPDKSIAHRAALLAALGDGTSYLVNYPEAADPQSTLSCLRALGIRIEEEDGLLEVEGRGIGGFDAPAAPLDCGNSGTTMRMLAGILAGQTFGSILVGDASLSVRPMNRVADPLRTMGARIELNDSHAPIGITGSRLRGITYPLPVPSAQVKSCVLLAGLHARGETTVVETVPSRDHTERMLGLDVLDFGGERHLTVQGGMKIAPRTWTVPADFSAAAFFLVAGSVVPEGELRLPGVGLNPTRSALLDVLRAMGARISVQNERDYGGETIADLTVTPAPLQGIRVDGPLIANLIDEIPVLAVAACFAEGRTEIRDAAELRVKETDRIEAVATSLRAFGADVETFPDGLAVTGGVRLHGAAIDSRGDHRIAMAMAIAGMAASGRTTILRAEAASVSFPSFWSELERLRAE